MTKVTSLSRQLIKGREKSRLFYMEGHLQTLFLTYLY